MLQNLPMTNTKSAASTAPARLELWLLYALLLVLPTLEGPKNAMFGLFLIVWTARRFSMVNLRHLQLDMVEYSLIALIATSAVATFANWPFPNGVKGLWDTLRFTLLFWCIYRAGYSEPQRHGIAASIIIGAAIGLGWGLLDGIQGRSGQLQFHSAGIVSQSAIYLGVTFILSLAMAWSGGRTTGTRRAMVLCWAAAVVFIIGLFLMGSRGPIVAVVIACLVFASMFNRRRVWLVLAGLIGMAALLAQVLPDQFDQHRAFLKTWRTVTTGTLVEADQGRFDYWRIAAAQIREGGSLWLGIGPRNFRSIDVSLLNFNPPLHLSEAALGSLGHAHNLFLNKLVEEGVVGLAALVFFFSLVARRLWRAWHQQQWRDWRWFAAFGALAVPVIAGSVNTPFYQEHAMLAMTLMAIFMQPSQPVGYRR